MSRIYSHRICHRNHLHREDSRAKIALFIVFSSFMRDRQQQFFSQEHEEGVGTFIFEIVKVLVLVLVVVAPVRIFLFQPFFVQGASMEPNFENGEYLIINEFGYKKTEIHVGNQTLFTMDSRKEFVRGDVVVFRYPRNPEQFFIKRVIGLPGETVTIAGGRVLIKDTRTSVATVLDESDYLDPSQETVGSLSVTLGADEYFVLGDNRSFSHDSRAWGAVRKDHVIGKVILRAWPFHAFAHY